MDTLTPLQRSERMTRVRATNTKPELAVRRLAHRLGYRYQLHRRNLPGTPDMVFAGRRKVVFVHGCFWHRHAGCALARLPKTRQEFWLPKLTANAARDKRHAAALRRLGWGVMTIWECELRQQAQLASRLRRFLDA
jgi:DNA mismatch endonuclease (patch repair protein)